MSDVSNYLKQYSADLKQFGVAVKKCLALGLYPAEIINNCPHPEQATADMDRLGLTNATPDLKTRAKWAPTK